MSGCATSSEKRENGGLRTSAGIAPPSRLSRSCKKSGIPPAVKWLRDLVKERISLLALLAGGRHDYLHLARPLLRAMEASHRFHVKVATDVNELNFDHAQVVLVASDHPLHPGQAGQLTEFVRRGGGLV